MSVCGASEPLPVSPILLPSPSSPAPARPANGERFPAGARAQRPRAASGSRQRGPQRPPVRPLTACTTHHTNCRLSDGQPFHCLIVGYNTTRVVAIAWRSPWLVACVWRDGACAAVACGGFAPGGGIGVGACRAPGHAPPSRTTRTDTWCTGPAMSWERDVRVHIIT